MAVRYSTGCFNKLLGTASLKDIFADGVINIYTGTQPLSADNAATGTLLATVTVDAGAFAAGVATNGLEFDAPVGAVISKAAAENWKYTGGTAGTAGWFRLVGNAADGHNQWETSSPEASSTTLPRIDGSIGVSSGDMRLSNVNIAVGAPGTIDEFNITLSNP
jgi:hypothetical protein